MPEPCGKPYDVNLLGDRVRPLELRHARATGSTNTWAKLESQAGTVRAPALFVADSQEAGRGRGTNTWWSAPGNIAATFVMPQNAHLAFGLVPLLAGLALRRALVTLTACEEIALKWPNDLVVGRRKTAGLLCERLQQVDLIGVGVNVNAGSQEAPAELRERIVALRELTGNAWDLNEVLCEISHQMLQVLSVESQSATHKLLREYSRHHWPTGKNVELVDTDRAPRVGGRCAGIDSQGRLVLNTGLECHPLLTGSIVSVTSV